MKKLVNTLLHPFILVLAHLWSKVIHEFEEMEYKARMKAEAEYVAAKAKAEAEKQKLVDDAKAAAEKAGLATIHPLTLRLLQESSKAVDTAKADAAKVEVDAKAALASLKSEAKLAVEEVKTHPVEVAAAVAAVVV